MKNLFFTSILMIWTTFTFGQEIMEVPAADMEVPATWNGKFIYLHGNTGIIDLEVPDDLPLGFQCTVMYVGNAYPRFVPKQDDITVLIYEETASSPPRFKTGKTVIYLKQRVNQPNQIMLWGDLADTDL